MKIRIRIKTPPGQARGTEAKIRWAIIGKAAHTMQVNEDDSEIIWEIQGDPKKILAINRNVTYYGLIVKSVFENKLFKKTALARLNPEDKPKLEAMLTEQTKVEVIKEGDAT